MFLKSLSFKYPLKRLVPLVLDTVGFRMRFEWVVRISVLPEVQDTFGNFYHQQAVLFPLSPRNNYSALLFFCVFVCAYIWSWTEAFYQSKRSIHTVTFMELYVKSITVFVIFWYHCGVLDNQFEILGCHILKMNGVKTIETNLLLTLKNAQDWRSRTTHADLCMIYSTNVVGSINKIFV